MDFLPINIRISSANILIVGGGRVATHKAQILSRFTSKATVIAKKISNEIKALNFKTIEKEFQEDDLNGVTLLYVCTQDRRLNHKIKLLAQKRGILTSVCDSPFLCDFTSPAIFTSGSISVAVSSDAKDVKRSIRIRNKIKEEIENGILQIS
ncbi:MAG: bifunctional precorrin-2 dehydrogenase/sirohydrochlorin ferrochelatase [Bacteroidales bacterium]|nr:bifunctional precorrin-2 dehydrogenase/sirohydrochlorin ferrochelatase [Bacteroidales bacterium]